MENFKDFQPKVGRLKYSCYVFPQDIQDRMNNGEAIASESVTQYLVDHRSWFNDLCMYSFEWDTLYRTWNHRYLLLQ